MSPPGPGLAVLASRVRYEEKRIFAALERRGARYTHLDTRALTAGLDGPAGGPFTAALNREISHSRAYYAALLLEAGGVRAVNGAEVIAVCGDKVRTSLELRRAGLPTPRTRVALTPDAGLEAAEELGYPVVVKPLTGSWGRLAALARDPAEARIVMEHRAALPSPQQHIIYLQEYIDKPDRDIRVLVAGEEVVAASYRYSAGWRTNAARGGRSAPCPVTPELGALALAAAKAVGGGVLGVDVIEGPGGLYALEVNHNVEFRGLQEAHGEAVDVAGAIVAFAVGPA
ncbi:lysine biosynthesis protein LysX [Actinomadura sp. DC4]|uniref:lysine biosynthesis protein LysX n=1 Tax=Actinomadura sp. DC4 TaxID=3055069 RepID=UPI0025B0534B|nr:lysine biosynthesis protein LysX [Actinomadura sp. DC4]MDN3356272.1 lysine biosynthesis protein LysX [Actinomadura sp. DC4]